MPAAWWIGERSPEVCGSSLEGMWKGIQGLPTSGPVRGGKGKGLDRVQAKAVTACLQMALMLTVLRELAALAREQVRL